MWILVVWMQRKMNGTGEDGIEGPVKVVGGREGEFLLGSMEEIEMTGHQPMELSRKGRERSRSPRRNGIDRSKIFDVGRRRMTKKIIDQLFESIQLLSLDQRRNEDGRGNGENDLILLQWNLTKIKSKSVLFRPSRLNLARLNTDRIDPMQIRMKTRIRHHLQ